MNENFEKILARCMVALMYFSVMMIMWDIWWHEAIGRDEFWIPPHFPFYISITLAIILSIFGWYKTRMKAWKNLAIAFSLIPVSGFFDNLWHIYFGVENPQDPLPIIFWSPPHIVIVLVLMVSAILILPVISRDKNIESRRLFGSLIFGVILAGITFLVAPIQPMGLYENFMSHYFGYAGAGVIAFLTIGTLLVSQRWVLGLGATTIVTAFYLILMGVVGTGQNPGSGLILLPQKSHPSWIIIFSYLAAALSIDVTASFPLWLRGLLAALFWSLIFYIFGILILKTILDVTLYNIITAIVASAGGGALAGYSLEKFYGRK